MSTVVLDTGVLGVLCLPTHSPKRQQTQDWLVQLQASSIKVAIPEIADYELRRELIRLGRAQSLGTLDRLTVELQYHAITTRTMRRAAELWAEARRNGRVTASDQALDGDVILAAQVIDAARIGDQHIVATTNVRHLSWFVDAREWTGIDARSFL